MSEKVQKVLANLGLGSRREIERWIQLGRIKINGQLAKIGDRVHAADQLLLDNKAIELKASTKLRVLLYHKPVGEVCTRQDEKDRPTVFDRLPPVGKGRWIMIGRLDLNTSGLLLFTNEGEVAYRLMHPKYEIEREYAVRLLGQLSFEVCKKLKEGIWLEEGFARFKDIVAMGGKGHNQWYRVILTEGRNREVRRLFESQGLVVNRLMRIRFGHITLPRIQPGDWRELTDLELERLHQLIGK